MRHEAHASGPGPGQPGTPRDPRVAGTGSLGAPVGKPAPIGTAAPGGKPVSPAPEWAVQALDKVDEIVVKVRTNTTDRLARIARVVVFGLLAAIMGSTAGVLALIGLVRGLDELLPGPVWVVYLLLGAIFTAAGAFLWAKKTPRPAAA